MTINMKLWETEAASVERGQTIRVNHTDCAAGQDTRRRLYLTRPASSAGVVLGFCHNCQEHGILRDGIDEFRDFDLAGTPTEKVVPFDQPSGMINDPNLWPTAAKAWRMGKRLPPAWCERACIKYDPSTHRIFLPMWDQVDKCGSPKADSCLMGYQLRRLEGTDAKYLTALANSNVKPYTRFEGRTCELCVLVEDLASGIVLSQTAWNYGVNVLVNYGIKVIPETLAENVDCIMNVVWLDNDGDIVTKQANTIARTWSLLSGTHAIIETARTDPKHYTPSQIRDALDEWRVV